MKLFSGLFGSARKIEPMYGSGEVKLKEYFHDYLKQEDQRRVSRMIAGLRGQFEQDQVSALLLGVGSVLHLNPSTQDEPAYNDLDFKLVAHSSDQYSQLIQSVKDWMGKETGYVVGMSTLEDAIPHLAITGEKYIEGKDDKRVMILSDINVPLEIRVKHPFYLAAESHLREERRRNNDFCVLFDYSPPRSA